MPDQSTLRQIPDRSKQQGFDTVPGGIMMSIKVLDLALVATQMMCIGCK